MIKKNIVAIDVLEDRNCGDALELSNANDFRILGKIPIIKRIMT